MALLHETERIEDDSERWEEVRRSVCPQPVSTVLLGFSQSKVWTLFSGWGYGGKLVTLSGLLVVFYLNKNFK